MSTDSETLDGGVDWATDVEPFTPNTVDEVDAKGMWCPETRYFYGVEDNGSGVNRAYNKTPEKFAPCLGSRCMAWRWSPDGGPTGYCGKAGPV